MTILPLVSEGVVENSQQSDSLTHPASSALVCNKQIADNYCVFIILLSACKNVRLCLFVCVCLCITNQDVRVFISSRTISSLLLFDEECGHRINHGCLAE